MDRRTETLVGSAFLVGMVLALVLAVWTFEGAPTVLLIIMSLVFLGVALFFLSGGSRPSPSSAGEGAAQQQSIVLGGSGEDAAISQSTSTVHVVCESCEERVPEAAAFCPSCGDAMGA